MAADDREDEALVLTAAVFAGDRAHMLLGGLEAERAERCRERLRAVQVGEGDARRKRLAARLRRLFAPSADVERLAGRLALERPEIQALIVGDLPAAAAIQVAALLKLGPTKPAAPAAPVRAWLRRFLLADVGS